MADMEVEGAALPQTPSSLRAGPSLDGPRRVKSSYSPISPFYSRATKFVAQFCFNAHLRLDAEGNPDPEPDHPDGGVVRRLPPIPRCEIEVLSSGPDPLCRYMRDRIEDRWRALERRTRNFARHLAEVENVTASHHAALASQEPVCVVGRVCSDGEDALSENSVVLEGSVEYSGGQRVRLDLRNIPQFSLFPGQVIAVEGHNPSGHCLVASRIFDSLPCPRLEVDEDGGPAAKRQASSSPLWKQPAALGSPSALTIVAAAGPFTTSDNLAFEPLVELLGYAVKKRPNLLLLMGPFVDSEHPSIKSGLATKTFKRIFDEEVRSRIESYCEDMGAGARVALVPSSRDSHHVSVFPQPPFNADDFEDPHKLMSFFANPVVFRCNELNIGCCTLDILRHLSSEEISRVAPGTGSDRMTRLSNHIIGQRSFYPLYPPAIGTVVDFSLAPGSLDLPCNPDILFLPSDLNPFAKVFSPLDRTSDSGDATRDASCLSVNPGRLAKGINGGTFAEILLLPSTGVEPPTRRTKVAIVKI